LLRDKTDEVISLLLAVSGVFVENNCLVDVVRNKIEIAIVVQIDVSCTIGKCRQRGSPFFRLVFEDQRAVISEYWVGQLDVRQSRQFFVKLLLSRFGSAKGTSAKSEKYKVEIRDVISIPVYYVEDCLSVVFDIGKKVYPYPYF